MNVDLTLQEIEALKLIATKKVSCEGLAESLKVSRPTAARVVSSLRKKGFRVSTRREQAHWSYEILPQPDRSIKNMIGMLGSKAPKDGSARHDDYIIEQLEEKSRKAKKSLKKGA
jgi:biotin operon repressor